MLSESFIAASSAPPRLVASNSTLLKDAGIFVHAFQPQPALRSTFKKSVAGANCLAVSATHIFAAQADRAVVHVYNREKANHEATVPFPERIHSLALAVNDTILALGTEHGSIMFWDTTTGRQTWTPPSHLQPVTALAVDPHGAHILSGSADSTVLVWSLADLLSFTPSASTTSTEDLHIPRRTLSAHRGAIVSLVTGHSTTSANIAISISTDSTACIWNYHTGVLLRTALLAAAPICAALDPADRGFYIGLSTGGVQAVDFYAAQPPTSIGDPSLATTPLQPGPASHWPAPSAATDGAALSIAVSYDGTTLLTGHASGAILTWDVASSASTHFRARLAEHAGAPISNLVVLAPTGFRTAAVVREVAPRLHAVVKPRPHDNYSSPTGRPTGAWRVSGQFPVTMPRRALAGAGFDAILDGPGFTADFLAASLAELSEESRQGAPSAAAPSAIAPVTSVLDPAADVISLDSAGANKEAEYLATIAQRDAQIEHLKKLQKVAHAQIARLVKDKASAGGKHKSSDEESDG